MTVIMKWIERVESKLERVESKVDKEEKRLHLLDEFYYYDHSD